MRYILTAGLCLASCMCGASSPKLQHLYGVNLQSDKGNVLLNDAGDDGSTIAIYTGEEFCIGMLNVVRQNDSGRLDAEITIHYSFYEDDTEKSGWVLQSDYPDDVERAEQYELEVEIAVSSNGLIIYIQDGGDLLSTGSQFILKRSVKSFSEAIKEKRNKIPPPFFSCPLLYSTKPSNISLMQNQDVWLTDEWSNQQLSLRDGEAWIADWDSDYKECDFAAKCKVSLYASFTGCVFIRLNTTDIYESDGDSWERTDYNGTIELLVENDKMFRAIVIKTFWSDPKGNQVTRRATRRGFSPLGKKLTCTGICGFSAGSIYDVRPRAFKTHYPIPFFEARKGSSSPDGSQTNSAVASVLDGMTKKQQKKLRKQFAFLKGLKGDARKYAEIQIAKSWNISREEAAEVFELLDRTEF